jgi:DNA-binding response OmpR family regulator
MHLSAKPLVVAVLDSDPDTLELLKSYFEIEGIAVATGSLIDFRLGKASLVEFLQRTTPDVVVYDLGPPYESNYNYLQKSRLEPGIPRCEFVITTTNARAVRGFLGIEALEILGKPYDLGRLVQAVRAAANGAAPATPSTREGDERRHRDRRQKDRRANDTGPADRAPLH